MIKRARLGVGNVARTPWMKSNSVRERDNESKQARASGQEGCTAGRLLWGTRPSPGTFPLPARLARRTSQRKPVSSLITVDCFAICRRNSGLPRRHMCATSRSAWCGSAGGSTAAAAQGAAAAGSTSKSLASVLLCGLRHLLQPGQAAAGARPAPQRCTRRRALAPPSA